MSEETICGCGNRVRYMVGKDKWACNKYSRCPTYKELESLIGELREEKRFAITTASNLMSIESNKIFNERLALTKTAKEDI